jgi:N-acetyl-alpha-D-muramate 1-phosphate uridylyltransferase
MFRHCVIMAAGDGSRLSPLNKERPKPLIEINGLPLISYSLRQVRDHIGNIVVTAGYLGGMVSRHVFNEGAGMILSTTNKGNAWWVFHSLLNQLNEPLLVLPCDLLVELDIDYLFGEYARMGRPPCLLFPVEPVEDISGDYIEGKDGMVHSMSRDKQTGIYSSGIQILNPLTINSLTDPCDDFNKLWHSLISKKALLYAGLYPYEWYSVNTKDQLYRANQLNIALNQTYLPT